MEVAGKVCIVTGGARGIGRAIGSALVDAGARVVLADLDSDATAATATEIGRDAVGVGCDVADSAALEQLLARAEKEFGLVDMFFANAGVGLGPELGDESDWDAALDVNVRAHIRAARLLVPQWLERGEGYFIATASAAGLVTQIGSAPYAVSKHAAVAFAEWLSLTYGDRGVRVSCLCPMGVNTAMLNAVEPDGSAPVGPQVVKATGRVLEPAEVASEVLAAVRDERFLILPHPEVLEFFRRKGSDYERWLAGMRRLQRSLLGLG